MSVTFPEQNLSGTDIRNIFIISIGHVVKELFLSFFLSLPLSVCLQPSKFSSLTIVLIFYTTRLLWTEDRPSPCFRTVAIIKEADILPLYTAVLYASSHMIRFNNFYGMSNSYI